MSKTPHKHAAIIKAWADGAEIEIQRDPPRRGWDDCHNPSWRSDRTYRVKPEPHKWQKEMDAFAPGKTIQYHYPMSGWKDCKKPIWGVEEFDSYRIKPEEDVRYMCAYEGHCFRKTRDEDDNIKLTFVDGRLEKVEKL